MKSVHHVTLSYTFMSICGVCNCVHCNNLLGVSALEKNLLLSAR